jgi:hypothetical protein
MTVLKPWALVLVCGCQPASVTLSPGETTDSTGTDTRPTATEAQVTEVTARIHENMGSIVVVTWEQGMPADTWVEYSFDEGLWLKSPTTDTPEGSQEAWLLGVPFGTEVTYRVANDFGAGALLDVEAAITTDDLPTEAPDAVVTVADDSGYDTGTPWVLTSTAGDGSDWHAWVFIIDRQGRTVWARETQGQFWTMHVQPSHDQTRILIDFNSFWATFDGGVASRVDAFSIDGERTDVWETPRLHHAFTQLADGSMAWGSATNGFRGDETIEILDPAGNTQTLWSCWEWLSSIGQPTGECGSNTLRWDALTDTFLFSIYSLDTVIEVDATTGETERWFGHVPGAWGFDPPESAFYWQHGGHFTETGTLLTSSEYPEGSETVVREYELDVANEQLVEVWSFGVGEDVYGATMGEAHRLANGNTLHNYGSATRLREVTSTGEVVWDVSWPSVTEEIGRSTPLTDLYAFLP